MTQSKNYTPTTILFRERPVDQKSQTIWFVRPAKLTKFTHIYADMTNGIVSLSENIMWEYHHYHEYYLEVIMNTIMNIIIDSHSNKYYTVYSIVQ